MPKKSGVIKVKLLMGNEAMALGAIHAGVDVVTGYPGTPSSEVLEYIAMNNKSKDIYIEWSVNEKVAMEVAAGASYGGKRTLVTMKQVGLNVASDPLMNLAYIGVGAGLVVLVADDPGPISSQTEQDTRAFGNFSKVPVLDPSTPEEAYRLIIKAFDLSEKYNTPVIIRPTTRICHGSVSFNPDYVHVPGKQKPFEKDPRWVIFPKLSYEAHLRIEKRNPIISDEFSNWSENIVIGSGKLGIISHGINHAYTMENLQNIDQSEFKYLKLTTAYPFPDKLIVDFIKSVDSVLVIEELSPYIENEVLRVCGKYHLNTEVYGKNTGDIQSAGENSVEIVGSAINKYLGKEEKTRNNKKLEVPVRPPVLCAGCPHRGAFYYIKTAMKGKKAVFSGDIGCYTLGNAKPLEMVDTCLCMGAGITISQGLKISDDSIINFAFIGDSTFFHSGLTGVVNAVYNNTDLILVVLDNGTTAMTGKQPHPGTGITMMQEFHKKIDIPNLLTSLGVERVEVLNPFEESCTDKITDIAEGSGVRALVFKSPCIKLFKAEKIYSISNECIGCKKCARELGCPALIKDGDKMKIDKTLCYGCGICMPICPVHAISEVV